jgi:hypothetical protein
MREELVRAVLEPSPPSTDRRISSSVLDRYHPSDLGVLYMFLTIDGRIRKSGS